jgi:hypothetical protein
MGSLAFFLTCRGCSRWSRKKRSPIGFASHRISSGRSLSISGIVRPHYPDLGITRPSSQ